MNKKAIISAVNESADGTVQVRTIETRRNTLGALSRAGYHWRCCGGWTAISRPDVECPEPGEHILIRDFAKIAPALRSMPAGFGYWDLYFTVSGFNCCATFDMAVRYAVRKGLIPSADWMKNIL